VLFSSRKIPERLPAPSAVKAARGGNGPSRAAASEQKRKPLFSEAAVKEIFCCAKASPENASGKSVPSSFKRVASTM